jgi:hypothetical protein
LKALNTDLSMPELLALVRMAMDRAMVPESVDHERCADWRIFLLFIISINIFLAELFDFAISIQLLT